MRKYKILSSCAIVNMLIEFSDGKSKRSEIVGVDMAKDYVYFYNKTAGVDYDDLEQEILCSVRPPVFSTPIVDMSILNNVLDMKNKKPEIRNTNE